MMDFLVYDGKVAVALLVFYLFYRFLLKKETFHRFNRVVLVGTAVLSFLLPLCIITIHKPIEVAPVIPEPAIVATEVPAQELVPLVEPAVPWWPTALTILFWAGVAFVLARVTLSILSIVRIIRRGRLAREEDGCKIIVTERDIDPFSWMKYIVLSGKDWEAPHASILAHEKAHIGLGHSLEVLLVDILSALQWFNPAIWMLRADLQELHEYEADDAVLRAGTNIKEYQYLLIRKAVSKSGYSVANSFNHSILKNRITMMSKSKSPLSRGLRVLWMLPLVCLAIGLQARTVYVPTDKDSENSLIGETSMLSGSAWKGDEGVLSFFDKTFEIRSENFVISGDYSLEGSSVTLTFKKVRNETTGKEKQGEDSLTGAIEGNILTIQLDKTTATFRRIVPDETSNHVLPEVTVVKYAPAHVKPEDIIHASDLENFKATGEADFDIAPKCDENFALWLNSRIKYPAECLWEGTALVQFTVDKKGKVRGVNVLHGVCDELDNQLINLISQSPSWTPAKKGGKPVATVLIQPVTFVIRTAGNANPPQASPVVLNVRADGSVESGGKVYTPAQLKDLIAPHQAGQPQTTVTIIAADNVPMGVIDDVKMELRKLESLKVRYASVSGKEGATRYMPPLPAAPTGKKGSAYPEVYFPEVNRENLFAVRINSADRVFFGDKPRSDDEEMLRAGKEFLRKRGNKALFALTVDRGASYGAYSHMQSLLWQIYEEVRDEKAHEVYGKSLHELTTDEQSQINWMVPMSIFEAGPKG